VGEKGKEGEKGREEKIKMEK